MKKPIKSLTGLRFVFAVFLFIHHFDIFQDLNVEGYWNVMNFFKEGYVAVDFFFILSGFVISYSYFSRVESGKISGMNFLANRIFKLWPVHILLWVLAVYLYSGKEYFWSNVTSKQFAAGLFLLQSFIPDMAYTFWGNSLSWSVSTELFFYVAFIMLVRLRSSERKCLFAGILGVVLLNSLFLGNETPIASWLYYVNPVFRLVDFLAGMLLCEWWEKSNYRPATARSATLLEVGSILVMLVFICLHSMDGVGYDPKTQTIYYLIPCLLVIYAFSFDKGYISKILSKKLFQVLGGCSFALYMVHQIVLFIVKQSFYTRIVDVKSMWFYGLLALLLSIILGVFLHYAIEEPANRFLRSCWRKWEARHSDN